MKTDHILGMFAILITSGSILAGFIVPLFLLSLGIFLPLYFLHETKTGTKNTPFVFKMIPILNKISPSYWISLFNSCSIAMLSFLCAAVVFGVLKGSSLSIFWSFWIFFVWFISASSILWTKIKYKNRYKRTVVVIGYSIIPAFFTFFLSGIVLSFLLTSAPARIEVFPAEVFEGTNNQTICLINKENFPVAINHLFYFKENTKIIITPNSMIILPQNFACLNIDVPMNISTIKIKDSSNARWVAQISVISKAATIYSD